MKVIRFFSSFANSSDCMDIYKRLCQTEDDPDYDRLYCFTDGDVYTHAVIMNNAMPILNIPKENVIGLAFESIEILCVDDTFAEYAVANIGKYFIGTSEGLPYPFISHFSFMWHCTPPRSLADKTKMMSIIFSKETFAPGHRYRHDIVYEILNSNLPIDIYGVGCELLHDVQDSRIKGRFLEHEPYIGYKYHIAIENFQNDCYISEKFMNAVLHGCIPLYWGARYIEKYFPNSCFQLLGRLDSDMVLISAIFEGKLDCIKKTPHYPESLKLTEYIKKL